MTPLAGFTTLFLLFTSVAAADPRSTTPAQHADCRIATYRLNDSTLVDIAPTTGVSFRWRRFDGTTGALRETSPGIFRSTHGWTDRDDNTRVSFSDCSAGAINFNGVPGERIALDITNTTFRGKNVDLAGRLVMPKGTGKVPVVILVHGAEPTSALQFYFFQRLLPAEGIGVFVYDKRGTGSSGGKYSQDFSLLADDAVAAMREARRLAGPRAGRVGYEAGSQGGWVAPLAANRAPVDFVIVGFGLAVSVVDEDHQQVEMEMRDKGHPPEVIARAQEVARAAQDVIASGFKTGFAELDAARARYGKEPWYKDLRGNFTYRLLPHSEAELREMAPKYDWGTPFRYDPMPALRANTTPQLWILGGRDYEAPAAETSRRIKSLIAEGRPFNLALYPHAEHGLTLFETDAKGERISTRYVPGYFAMVRDFARHGRLSGAYGDAEITLTRR